MSGAHHLIEAAWQARRDGRHDEAERQAVQGIAVARQAGARADLITALKALGHIVCDDHQNERALRLYEEAVALCREEHDPLLLAHTVRHLGDVHRHASRPIEADRCYSEALALYRGAAQPPPLDVANAMRPAALVKEATGDLEAAKALWSDARRLYDMAGVQVAAAECSRRLSRLSVAEEE